MTDLLVALDPVPGHHGGHLQGAARVPVHWEPARHDRGRLYLPHRGGQPTLSAQARVSHRELHRAGTAESRKG